MGVGGAVGGEPAADGGIASGGIVSDTSSLARKAENNVPEAAALSAEHWDEEGFARRFGALLSSVQTHLNTPRRPASVRGYLEGPWGAAWRRGRVLPRPIREWLPSVGWVRIF